MSRNYIAILGRQPELGLVELESRLGAGQVRAFGGTAALCDAEIQIDRLGGAVKLGQVLGQYRAEDLVKLVLSDPVLQQLRPLVAGSGKVTFALSVYGDRSRGKVVQAAGLELKRALAKAADGSMRVVAPKGRDQAVSVAQLKFNRVLERGFELMVVFGESEVIVAKTTAVQDIDWYSRRDYGRPARSAKVGMLPPKLAQVLVNTTATPVVADPFCGTGVVLQEALLMGREAVGTDLAPEMVAASRENLLWLESEIGAAMPSWTVEADDARTVKLPAGCAVVTEGYLGPNLTHSPTPVELDKIRTQLLELYRSAMKNFARQQLAGSEVSLCAPAWRMGRKWVSLGLVDELPDLGYTLKGFEAAPNPLLYSREDQVVGRQLLLLRKN